MHRRGDALKEALQNNEKEFQRWQMFLKENETAIENMTNFSKQLTVDVMVPIGKKALMPGHLLHTNEILVSHYQGYFSKCTVLKAKEICEFRIKMAKENLKKLELEADLWQNKLDKPYDEGVIASGEEQEIIEDFDEEAEKLWKQEHRKRLKQAKQKEREEREKVQTESSAGDLKEKTDDEIFKMLEEAELMEELEQELNTLEIDEVNDDTLRKLMSGETKLPNKKERLVHVKDDRKENDHSEKPLSPNIVKIKDIDISTSSRTNNNVQCNPEICLADTLNEDEEIQEEDTLPEEVVLIKQQAKYLDVEDQIGFYDYQIQIIRQKLQILPLHTPEELNEKIHLLNVMEYLEELLEEAEESIGAEELAIIDKDETSEEQEQKTKNLNESLIEITSTESNVENTIEQKRRISFALEDQTLEFRNHEAVTQMLPSKIEGNKRDIITLDGSVNRKKECHNKVENFANKQELIEEKVNKNLQYVAENQSIQDFDLVQKILDCSKDDNNTLYIKFKHSQNEGYRSKEIPDTIDSPADVYKLFVQQSSVNKTSTIFVNSYEGEEQVIAPVLKETDRKDAFVDLKSEFSNPQAKSILKNKSAVGKENHFADNKERNTDNKKRNKKSNKKDDDLLSAYDKVMNEVIEKPLTEPEPLPDVKFIDAHTPKKRVSRFKQMRQGNGTT